MATNSCLKVSLRQARNSSAQECLLKGTTSHRSTFAEEISSAEGSIDQLRRFLGSRACGLWTRGGLSWMVPGWLDHWSLDLCLPQSPLKDTKGPHQPCNAHFSISKAIPSKDLDDNDDNAADDSAANDETLMIVMHYDMMGWRNQWLNEWLTEWMNQRKNKQMVMMMMMMMMMTTITMTTTMMTMTTTTTTTTILSHWWWWSHSLTLFALVLPTLPPNYHGRRCCHYWWWCCCCCCSSRLSGSGT